MGAGPTRPSLRPEATGAVMEVLPFGEGSRAVEEKFYVWATGESIEIEWQLRVTFGLSAAPSRESAPGDTADENPRKRTFGRECQLPRVVRA